MAFPKTIAGVGHLKRICTDACSVAGAIQEPLGPLPIEFDDLPINRVYFPSLSNYEVAGDLTNVYSI